MLSLGKENMYNLPIKRIKTIHDGMKIQLGPFAYTVCSGLASIRRDNWYLLCKGHANSIIFSMLGYSLKRKYEYLHSIGVSPLADGDFPYLSTEGMIKCINCLLEDCYKHQQQTK